MPRRSRAAERTRASAGVGLALGPANLEHRARFEREIERLAQVEQEIGDGDRLRLDSDQRGVTISGRRSTSARIISNDRLPAPMTIEARNSTTARRRDAAVPRPRGGSEVRRQSVPIVPQGAEIDDAADSGRPRRRGEVLRGPAIGRSKSPPVSMEWTR